MREPLENLLIKRLTRFIVGVSLSVVVTGCALTPADRLDSEATELGFDRALISGKAFSHAFYRPRREPGGRTLHVYLDGDGRPWKRYRTVSFDPTPGNPLLLKLMSRDPASSLYLGRPCYHGLVQNAPCNSYYWTSARYSEAVIESMEVALRKIVMAQGYDQLVLVGYSGGATIAMLLAPHFIQTRAVITLAGNLDPDAWTAFHHYTPLIDSLNPTFLPPLRQEVLQLHFAGENDRNIPPAMLRKAVTHQKGAMFEVVDGFTHRCCWYEAWPEILSKLPKRLR